MDGTIVDSEPYWMRAETELVTSFGGRWSHDDALTLIGAGLWHTAATLRSRGVQLTEDAVVATLTDRVQQLIREHGVPWRPGARELLLEVREAGIPTALVTMSVRRMAEQIAAEIPFDAFDVLITGDEVEAPKPHPAPYLAAAAAVGVNPQDAIAIEDSVAGLASAVAAGTIAIGVPHMVPLPDTDEHTIWPTLKGRSLADLDALVESAREPGLRS